MKLFLVSAASLFALTLAGAASAATEVELKDVAARVVVTPENRQDVELKVAYGKAQVPQIMVHTTGNKLVADGKLRNSHLECKSGNTVNIGGMGNVAQADLPVVYIKVPMDAKVAVSGATTGQVGASSSLEFSQGGCGNWTLGDVGGKSEINIGGSGDVTAGNSHDLEVNIGGSGNFRGQGVQTLEANIGGNGDINLARITGTAEVNIGGSGNVILGDGSVSSLEVNIAGSGDVRFAGEAKDVEVNIVGSGDVRVKRVTGNVSKSILGSGNIIVGQ